MKRSWTFLVITGLTMLMSCAAPPKMKIDRVYSGLSESLPRLDPGILEGRRILIDPGHGGFFRGTVGQDSLAEAQVNLGVGLYLWGLLKEAGADVYLTRSAEKDFLAGPDSALALDLQRRVDMAESLRVDMFISLHHNAQSDRDPKVNRVETYYRSGDPASLDLAFSVHRHLMRNLGITTGEVRQGNYYVLRQTTMPAVLGEASYLSSPTVEKQLKLSNKQRLEAEAYFLGILDFFHRGLPRLESVSPADSVLTELPVIVYRSEDLGGLGLDADAIEMTLNNRPVKPRFDRRTGRISFRLPWDSPNGPYLSRLGVRNLLGNSSRIYEQRFVIDFPPVLAVFDTEPALSSGGGAVRTYARLLDRRGMPVADGTPVDVQVTGGTVVTGDKIDQGALECWIIPGGGNGQPELTVRCRGQEFTQIISAGEQEAVAGRRVLVFDELTGAVIRDAVVLWGDSITQAGSSSGLYVYPTPLAGREVRLDARGYRPVVLTDQSGDTLRLTPWHQGKLTGQRFLIDPEGGPPLKTGSGPLGLPGSFVNLQIAKYLAGYLRGAGADVLLTRQSEETKSPQDIVILANRFRADRYIAIRQRAGSISEDEEEPRMVLNTYHFPGSRLGTDYAEKLAFALSGLLELPLQMPAEAVTYPLQQTACPAVVVEGGALHRIESELLLSQSWYLRRIAYSLFVGTLSHYESTERAAVRVTVRGPEDPGNWLVTVDNTWTLLTGPDGSATFHVLTAGAHSVEVQRADRRFSKTVEAVADYVTLLDFDIPVE